MRKKLKKTKLMKINEPLISINHLIPHLASLIALHEFLYGQYSEVTFPRYYLTIKEANDKSNLLIDECLEIDDNTQRNYYQKLIIALLFYLISGEFDIARYEADRSSFEDSEINTRMCELCFVLALKSESEIKLIIEYLFELKSISPDSALRKQIGIITEVLHNGKVDELCDSADLSIPFKANLLNYINLINFPYRSESAKRMFFIKLLSHVYLEICEGTLSLFNIHNSPDDVRKAFLKPTKPHPFFNYKTYDDYIFHRYSLINNFLTQKTNTNEY
ncbi:MAG: hypothetical protein U0T07_09745 [Chitinophagales bacterium]